MKYLWLTIVLCAAGCADSEPVVSPPVGTGGAGVGGATGLPVRDLIAEINAKRAEGGTCPPDTFTPVEPVTSNPILRNACRTFLDDQVARGTAPLTGDAASDALVQRAFAMGFVGQIIGYHAEIFMATPEEVVADWLSSSQCPGVFSRDMTCVGTEYLKVPESVRPDRWAILGGFLPPDLATSVLLDDFEDAKLDQTFVAAKMGKKPGEGGQWYGQSDANSLLVGVTSRPLSPRGEAAMGKRIWNAEGAVGEVGRYRYGLQLATDRVVQWVGMVAELNGPYASESMNLTELKAVSFSAKGTGTVRMQFHNRYQDGMMYFGTYITLNPTWTKYVVKVGDLALAPTVWGRARETTWEMVRDRGVALEFTFSGENDPYVPNIGPVALYLDNVRLYGIKYWEDYRLTADVE